jgi:NTP pyrophosphatase (non-canonical NTP hydrolase)
LRWETLPQRLRDFAAERAWQPFHSPKNLASALIVEAGELLEHFQWLTEDQSRALARPGPAKDAVAAEMADVLLYLVQLASALEVDLLDAAARKMVVNAPSTRWRRRAGGPTGPASCETAHPPTIQPHSRAPSGAAAAAAAWRPTGPATATRPRPAPDPDAPRPRRPPAATGVRPATGRAAGPAGALGQPEPVAPAQLQAQALAGSQGVGDGGGRGQVIGVHGLHCAQPGRGPAGTAARGAPQQRPCRPSVPVRSATLCACSDARPAPTLARAMNPLYRRIADQYRSAIHAGSLRPGDRFPSVRTLMRTHTVSLSTALQACRQLEDEGWLEARARSGYFVQHPRRRGLPRPPSRACGPSTRRPMSASRPMCRRSWPAASASR